MLHVLLDIDHVSEDVKRAFGVAKKAHRGQVDKAGKEYIYHPWSVATITWNLIGEKGFDAKFVNDCLVTALLHDVVEDTDVSIEYLKGRFSNEVIEALGYVTHDKSVPYMDYVENVSNNEIASWVKLADLMHNMDLTRFNHITEKEVNRLSKKYVPAYNYMRNILENK